MRAKSEYILGQFLGLTFRKDKLSGLLKFLEALFLLSFPVKFLVRYSAVRKQFGPPGKGEIPVLEYQMQVREVGVLSSLLPTLQI